MPFDVVFNIAYDRRRLLLERSKSNRIRHPDLLRGWFLARASGAVEQISSRLCTLPALFAVLSHQACACDVCSVRCRRYFRNPTILFSFTKRAVAILFASPTNRCCSGFPLSRVLLLQISFSATAPTA